MVRGLLLRVKNRHNHLVEMMFAILPRADINRRVGDARWHKEEPPSEIWRSDLTEAGSNRRREPSPPTAILICANPSSDIPVWRSPDSPAKLKHIVCPVTE